MSANQVLDGLEPLLKKYDVYGPRYTSYPTALQFSDAFDQDDYLTHVVASNDLPVPKPLSVYIHIPFCKSLCYYCGCNKIVTHKTEAAANYLEYLVREIDMHSQYYDGDRLLQQIHFGGGTPTYLNARQLREILEVIAQRFHFGLPDSLEMGIEIDPRTVQGNAFDELMDLGFNRISIGIQDFDPDVQKAINRIQDTESIRQIMAQARARQVKSISLDIIYGLPRQTQQSFNETLDKVIELRPDRIALYNYAHMPQRIPSQRLIQSSELPGAEEKMAIFLDSVHRLTEAGYLYIGMDHFALPEDSLALAMNNGSLQRNFQGYSTNADCDVIGVGVSAISRVNDSYSQNATRLSEYRGYLDQGQFPVSKGVSLSRDDAIRGGVIHELMCSGQIQFSEFNARHDVFFQRYFKDEMAGIAKLAEDGLVACDEASLRVTDRGRLFLRNIAMTFDVYYAQSDLQNSAQPRYSKTL